MTGKIATGEGSSASRNSILIVEDTPANLKLADILLSKNGFDVHTARTAEEALDMVRTLRPRVILADIKLPGMNGLEMTRRLKSAPETRHIVVLAVTAYALKGDDQKAFDAGCDSYITKPIDAYTFPGLIRSYLSNTSDTCQLPASRERSC